MTGRGPGKIAPSMMCVDLLHVERGLRELEAAGVDYLHVDVMDNHFVPNITLSPDFARALKGASRVPLDVHLMIERPERSLAAYDFLGQDDILCVHYEATPHIHRALAAVRSMGVRTAVALNPGTPVGVLEDLLPDLDMVLVMTVNPGYAGQALIPQTLDKVARCRRMLDAAGFADILLEVDGNVSFANAPEMRRNGADVFVCGTSSVFSSEAGIAANMALFRECIA